MMTNPEFQTVTEHIARVDLRFQVAEFISIPVAAWLVRAREGFALVDTGSPETSGQLVDAVSKATGGEGLKAVFLTHAHYDHAGALPDLRLAWDPIIISHEHEVPFLKGDIDYPDIASMNPAFWIGKLLMEPTTWGAPDIHVVRQDHSLFGMSVIHLPGHTPGQMGLLHRADKAVICGDAVMHLFGRLSKPFPFVTPDLKTARQSIVRLSERDFHHLLPSHGPPILAKGRQSLIRYVRKSTRKLFEGAG